MPRGQRCQQGALGKWSKIRRPIYDDQKLTNMRRRLCRRTYTASICPRPHDSGLPIPRCPTLAVVNSGAPAVRASDRGAGSGGVAHS